MPFVLPKDPHEAKELRSHSAVLVNGLFIALLLIPIHVLSAYIIGLKLARLKEMQQQELYH